MDAYDLMPGALFVTILVFIVGLGWLISREQDNAQERALACIAAGNQFVSGDCVSGPSKP